MSEAYPDRYILGQYAQQIATYNGVRNPQVVLEYIRQVKFRFDENMSNQRTLIRMSTSEAAAEWVDVLQKSTTWEELSGNTILALLKDEFCPKNHKAEAYQALITMKRGKKPLKQFLDEFWQLSWQISRDTPDAIINEALISSVGGFFAAELRRLDFDNFIQSFDHLYLHELYDLWPPRHRSKDPSGRKSDAVK